MKIGKIPNDTLNRLIIEPLNKYGVERSEVKVKPNVGEDCTAIDVGSELCILSTDPITGAAEDIGKLAVHINANDIASSGGEPIGIMVTALLPPYIEEKDIEKIMRDVYTNAQKVGIAVLGGHKPILSCTVVGKTIKRNFISSGGAKQGQSVVMTKYAGLEGTSILANDCEERLKGRVSEEIIENAKKLTEKLSVVKEGRIAAEMNVNAMHDVTEGGILGACWEVAECSGLGIEVDCDRIPILEETKEICRCMGINPLRLISSGSMLIACDNGEELTERLRSEGINAVVIGKFKESGMTMIINGEKEILTEPDADELYKALKQS